MADINCRKCGEPTDIAYTYDEMTAEERACFMRGEGCDCCGWGTKCPSCNGRGTTIEYRYIPEENRRHHVHTDEPCTRCGGTGKPTMNDAQYEDALFSLMESDEDITMYL